MKVYKYGSHEEYVAAQAEANRRKINNVWVRPETIERIAEHAPPKVMAIMCHGTRNGAEQLLFKDKWPRALVIGTEIADTAKNFKYTVQHDFHVQQPGWIGAFDIVYTNAFDHAMRPTVALRTWKAQLTPQGRLFLEYSFTPACNKSSASDPLEISEEELLAMLKRNGLKVIATFDTSGVKGAADCASKVYVAERA